MPSAPNGDQRSPQRPVCSKWYDSLKVIFVLTDIQEKITARYHGRVIECRGFAVLCLYRVIAGAFLFNVDTLTSVVLISRTIIKWTSWQANGLWRMASCSASEERSHIHHETIRALMKSNIPQARSYNKRPRPLANDPMI